MTITYSREERATLDNWFDVCEEFVDAMTAYNLEMAECGFASTEAPQSPEPDRDTLAVLEKLSSDYNYWKLRVDLGDEVEEPAF